MKEQRCNFEETLNQVRKKGLKQNGGITLIALVVTIIVLLILAGISIMMLTGQNRNLKESRRSKYKYRKSANNRRSKIRHIIKNVRKTNRRYNKRRIKDNTRPIF